MQGEEKLEGGRGMEGRIKRVKERYKNGEEKTGAGFFLAIATSACSFPYQQKATRSLAIATKTGNASFQLFSLVWP